MTTGLLKLKFQWSPVALDRTTLRYIIGFDCGSCPNTTDNTEVVCTDVVIGSQCTFTVQTQVCDSIVGNYTTIPLVLTSKTMFFMYFLIIITIVLI